MEDDSKKKPNHKKTHAEKWRDRKPHAKISSKHPWHDNVPRQNLFFMRADRGCYEPPDEEETYTTDYE